MADGHRSQEWWDAFWLGLAKYVAKASKDPSTQVGSVIVRPNKRFVSLGYNGFPQGVDDSPERYADRELKYKLIVHGELNAILFSGQDMAGCTLYTWPFMSCSRCAGPVIQAQIARAVAPEIPAELRPRWEEDNALANEMFEQAGVRLDLYPLATLESYWNE